MHIVEGFLPLAHAVGWSAVTTPFVVHGALSAKRIMTRQPQAKLLLGAAGGFAFVLSALKLPSLTGSSSHPTGAGLGAILFGPPVMALLGAIVLLFQALLRAHGGLTPLGANVFSMAVAGPWVAWAVHRLVARLGRPGLAVFLAAALGDLATYAVTACQLALAFPDPVGGVAASLAKFAGVFALTQVPLAVSEGFLTLLATNLLAERTDLPALAALRRPAGDAEVAP